MNSVLKNYDGMRKTCAALVAAVCLLYLVTVLFESNAVMSWGIKLSCAVPFTVLLVVCWRFFNGRYWAAIIMTAVAVFIAFSSSSLFFHYHIPFAQTVFIGFLIFTALCAAASSVLSWKDLQNGF